MTYSFHDVKWAVAKWPNLGEGLMVNSVGDVYRPARPHKGTGRMLPMRKVKQRLNRQGYAVINVVGNKRRVTVIKIHRLMVNSFMRALEPGEVTRHLDGVKTNNRLENLAIGTHQQNMDDMKRHGLPRNEPLTKLRARVIRKMVAEGKLTPRQLARVYGVQPRVVYKVLRGRTFTGE